jgi:VanZ family protein
MNTLHEIWVPDRRLNWLALWLAVGCLMIGAIVWLSLTSSPPVAMPGQSDKLYHALSYGVLMGWWLQLFPRLAARILLALAFIALGAGMEIAQSFHPLRYLDFADMAANTAGVAAAFAAGFTPLQTVLLRIERLFD